MFIGPGGSPGANDRSGEHPIWEPADFWPCRADFLALREDCEGLVPVTLFAYSVSGSLLLVQRRQSAFRGRAVFRGGVLGGGWGYGHLT